MLELKGLEKTFQKGTPDERAALRGVDLTLDDGEFVAVIGSNGAGKSTLFGAVAGSFFCDRGKILLDGADITRLPEHRRARKISRIFQDPMRGSAPGLTVAENIALAYARGERSPLSFALSCKKAALFREALASLGMGLEERMNAKMGTLSGGQRQAVTLLMATIRTPRLLLLDEHTAALDPVTAERITALTREIVGSHRITTMMITHRIDDALAVGSRTLMLEEGKIVLDLRGEARAALDVQGLLKLYREKVGRDLTGDRMLLGGKKTAAAE